MMKTCKTVLRTAQKMRDNGNWYPTFYELATDSKLHPHDVIEACKLLEKDKYIGYLYPSDHPEDKRIPNGISLTLKGYKPKEYAISQFRKYLKNNWISLVALIISICALIISISSAIFPGIVRVILLK
ncbi:hypothetical protein [Anaeromassilibacillus sp. An200]|uniref:hypothetical protein n=1 Tax=Anaeromassilibacillus sp. An200 TaxID=1965587 RepID=UPI00111E161F|nr:hypothetical protein [Anaeromassilibacillus sp. An200]